jgi:hypothetical protein
MMLDPHSDEPSEGREVARRLAEEAVSEKGSACPVNRGRFSISGMVLVGLLGLLVGSELAKATGGTGLLIEFGIPGVLGVIGAWLGSKIPFG